MSTEANNRIMDRVRALLAIAEHPGTGEHEADTALQQANSLIAKHAIDEAILRMSQTSSQRRSPESRKITFAGVSYEFSGALRTILDEVAKANRCYVALNYQGAVVYGASEDVAWTEMLFTSVYFQFLSKVAPKWDKDLGYDANVYSLKTAGKKWYEINSMSVENGDRDERLFEAQYSYLKRDDEEYCLTDGTPDENGRYVMRPTKKIKGTMIAAYKRHAKKIGDTDLVKTGDHLAYRLSFTEAFRARLTMRIREMAAANRATTDSIPGAAVALVGMGAAAQRLMWDENPNLDPESIASSRAAQEAKEAKELAERRAMLDAMTQKQRTEFLEKEEREYARLQKRREKNTRYYSYDTSALSKGRKAADAVDLRRNGGRAEAGATRNQIG